MKRPRRRTVVSTFWLIVLTSTISVAGTYEIPDSGWGLPGIVRVTGQLLLIRQPTGFEVLSLADPSNPSVLGEYNEAQETTDLELDGSMVILTDIGPTLAGRLILVSLADPSSPVEVSRLGIGFSAHVALAAEPAGAWTVDGDALSLHHFDLTDPEHPFEDAYHYDSQAWDILSWGRNLLVCGPSALEISEVGDRGSLTPLGAVPLPPGMPNGVAVRGRLAAVRSTVHTAPMGGGYFRLGLVDLTNPNQPELLHEWPDAFSDRFVDFAFGRRSLVVASGERGLAIADIRDPTHPGPLEFVRPDLDVVGLDTGYGRVYVLTAEGELVVVPLPGCWRDPVEKPVPLYVR